MDRKWPQNTQKIGLKIRRKGPQNRLKMASKWKGIDLNIGRK